MVAAVAKRPKKKSKPATKPKGKVLAKAKRPTAPPVKASKNGKPTNGATNGAAIRKAGKKFANDQPPLPSMEDVDERIPALEEVCADVLTAKKEYAVIGERIGKGLAKVGDLLREHDRTHYIVGEKKFVPVAGEATVKIYKVKQ